MKKRLSEEKGSMAVYVTVVLLSFLILVSGVYALSSANRKVQTKTTIEIKKSYEMYNDKKEKLYDKLSESFQPPDVKKGSINYETLLAVAGGSGSQDVGYRNSNGTGYPGQASSYKSPNNYTAYSTTTNAGTSSASVSGTMGISQFITYDAKGSYYTRNSGRAQGGYGGGGSQDDNYSYGGGWCKGTNTYQSTSWSLDTTATGTDGANSENGYAKITWISF